MIIKWEIKIKYIQMIYNNKTYVALIRKAKIDIIKKNKITSNLN